MSGTRGFLIVCLQATFRSVTRLEPRATRHVCIFCPPKEAAGARLYTHYYVLPTFNYYYRAAAPHPRRRGGEAQLLPTNNQDLSILERDRDINYQIKILVSYDNFMHLE